MREIILNSYNFMKTGARGRQMDKCQNITENFRWNCNKLRRRRVNYFCEHVLKLEKN